MILQNAIKRKTHADNDDTSASQLIHFSASSFYKIGYFGTAQFRI